MRYLSKSAKLNNAYQDDMMLGRSIKNIRATRTL